MEQLCHNKQGEINKINRWGGVAEATQPTAIMQHGAEANSGFGLGGASVWILAPLLDSSAAGTDRHSQQVVHHVPVRRDAHWHPGLRQQTHSK